MRAGEDVTVSNQKLKAGAEATVLILPTKYLVWYHYNVMDPVLVHPKLCLGLKITNKYETLVFLGA